MRGIEILPISRAVAARHARLRLSLRRAGAEVNMRAFDLLIAATALTHNLTLVTNNRRHFSDIAGLSLLPPA